MREKKEQKKMLRTLTKRSFRQKKGRNLVAVLAILMTAAMFTALFTLAQSMGKNLTEMYLRQSGTTAHASTKSITDEEIEKIASHPDVVSYGKSIVLGIAENEALSGRQVEIRCANDQYAKNDYAWPEEGRMPTEKNEIALDTLTLERLGVPAKLGEEVTIEWRPDVTSDTVTRSTFTLCGWWEGNLSSYASMAWVSESFALDACGGREAPDEGQVLGQRMMGISFDNSRDIEEKTAKVLEDCGITDVEFSPNLTYSSEMRQQILAENFPMYVGMVLVFLAGYLIIYNVFQISVASDIQFYGRLKTLGMTKKQLRKIIYGQANRLCLPGILAGLLLGYLLGMVLVPILLSSLEGQAAVAADPVIFIGSAVFTYATVLISCLLPARLAGKVSPVEALRYTDADTKIKKVYKKSKNGAKIPGMAWANLWRSKKRTFHVIAYLTQGKVLISFFNSRNASFYMEKYLMDYAVADFQIDDATNEAVEGYQPDSQTISNELLGEIQGLSGLEEDGTLYSRETMGVLTENAKENFENYYTQDVLDEFASFDPTFPQWKETYDKALAGEAVPFTVYGADGVILEAAASEQFLLNGTYDAEAFATGEYVLAIGPAVDPGTDIPMYDVGEKVEVEGRTFTVMAVLSPLQPMVEGAAPNFDIPLILPADTFREIWPEGTPRKYYFNVEEKAQEEAQTLLEEYQAKEAPAMNITSRQSLIQQYEDQTRSSAVMGYAISLIIALVGILNFVNSMVTAIISRKREFAMIQSIGMTKRQLRQMLIFEGLYYAGLTLVISYILGAVTVGVIVRALTAGGYTTFQFTLLPLIVCTPVLILFAVLIPYLCFRNLEKQSIVERLRAVD